MGYYAHCHLKDILHKVEEKNAKGEVWMVYHEKLGQQHICDINNSDVAPDINSKPKSCFTPHQSSVQLTKLTDLTEKLLQDLQKS